MPPIQATPMGQRSLIKTYMKGVRNCIPQSAGTLGFRTTVVPIEDMVPFSVTLYLELLTFELLLLMLYVASQRRKLLNLDDMTQ